jgi:hypothetical protein
MTHERVNALPILPEAHLLGDDAPGDDVLAGMAYSMQQKQLREFGELIGARKALLNRVLVPALQTKIQEQA